MPVPFFGFIIKLMQHKEINNIWHIVVPSGNKTKENYYYPEIQFWMNYTVLGFQAFGIIITAIIMPCTGNKKGGGGSFYTARKALEECHQHSSDSLYGKGFSCHFACDWIQECKLQAAECGRPNFIFNSYSLHKFLFLVSKKHGTALF